MYIIIILFITRSRIYKLWASCIKNLDLFSLTSRISILLLSLTLTSKLEWWGSTMVIKLSEFWFIESDYILVI